MFSVDERDRLNGLIQEGKGLVCQPPKARILLTTFRRKSLAWVEPKLVAGVAKNCGTALTCSVGKQRIAGRQTTQQSNHGFC